MTTVVKKFVLPRLSLTNDPRRVSKLVRTQAKAQPDEERPDPLGGWREGFSREAATDYLAELGAEAPERPTIEPRMPEDVTLLPSDSLGALHGQFVAYTEWIEVELALAEVSVVEAEAYLDHVEAEIRLVKAGTVKDKDMKTRNDPRFIAAEQTKIIAEAKAKILKARTKGYERCANALSREMTRRTGGHESS